MTEGAANYYAETYDQSVPDWPGEIFFYHELAREAKRRKQGVLEVACGTGRIAVGLARSGVDIVGLDLSPDMLAVARGKSAELPTIHWVEGDMRSFALGRMFGLVIVPGHSLQNLSTAADQASCLQCIKRHLEPGGLLDLHLDHQDVGWLADRAP